MLSITWQKYGMVEILPRNISIHNCFQYCLQNPASPNAFFPLLYTFFYFKLCKISTYPNKMDSKLVGINQMKLLI